MPNIKDDIAYGMIDPHTGEYISFKKVTKWWNGADMNDTLKDGVLYVKKDDEYYLRVLPDGKINLKWWGVKDGDDIFYALTSAIKAGGEGGYIFIPQGNYTCSDTIYLDSWSGTIEGEGGIYNLRTICTTISFPTRKDGFVLRGSYPTPGTSNTGIAGTILRKLIIRGPGQNDEGMSELEPERLTVGVSCYNISLLEDVIIQQWPGDGLVVYGSIANGTNVSLSTFNRVSVQQNGGNGVWTIGEDANQSAFIQLDARDNLGWGVNEQSFLGNLYIGCHCNANKLGPYNVRDDGNNRSAFVMCYSEQGDEDGEDYSGVSHFAGALIFGGLHGNTPIGGQFCNDFWDGISFKSRTRGSGGFSFTDGFMDAKMEDEIARIGKPYNYSEYIDDAYRGNVFRIGFGVGARDVYNGIALLGRRAYSIAAHGNGGHSSRFTGDNQLVRLDDILVDNRRIAFAFDGLESVAANTSFPWHQGDLIYNGDIRDESPIIGWRCKRSGQYVDTDLPNWVVYTNTAEAVIDAPYEEVVEYLNNGSVIQVDNNGEPVVIKSVIDMEDGTTRITSDGGLGWNPSGTSIQYIEPVWSEIRLDGAIDPDYLPPSYADETAAIAAGLTNGRIFRNGTQLHVVINNPA